MLPRLSYLDHTGEKPYRPVGASHPRRRGSRRASLDQAVRCNTQRRTSTRAAWPWYRPGAKHATCAMSGGALIPRLHTRHTGGAGNALAPSAKLLSYVAILPWVKVPHLASHLLAQLARVISQDWQRHHHPGTSWKPSLIRTDSAAPAIARPMGPGLSTGRGRTIRPAAQPFAQRALGYPRGFCSKLAMAGKAPEILMLSPGNSKSCWPFAQLAPATCQLLSHYCEPSCGSWAKWKTKRPTGRLRIIFGPKKRPPSSSRLARVFRPSGHDKPKGRDTVASRTLIRKTPPGASSPSAPGLSVPQMPPSQTLPAQNPGTPRVPPGPADLPGHPL